MIESLYANLCNSLMIDFVENKKIYFTQSKQYLNLSKKENLFSNKGPVWNLLRNEFESFLNLQKSKSLIPCSNGGTALEMLMSIKEYKRGRKIKWLISSFSFSNIGFGRTYDCIHVDCCNRGIIDFNKIKKLFEKDKNSFDGIIITNPFGLYTDFDKIIEWSRSNDKEVIIDNAAGLSEKICDHDFQSFSLHHTKPFGFGEGGLALIPKKYYDQAIGFIEYGDNQFKIPKNLWINNGKLSEISCAFILSRLNHYHKWIKEYSYQNERIKNIALKLDLKILSETTTPSMHLPFLFENEININKLKNTEVTFKKYYTPLKPLKTTTKLFNHIINIPCHPDMAKIENKKLIHTITKILKK